MGRGRRSPTRCPSERSDRPLIQAVVAAVLRPLPDRPGSARLGATEAIGRRILPGLFLAEVSNAPALPCTWATCRLALPSEPGPLRHTGDHQRVTASQRVDQSAKVVAPETRRAGASERIDQPSGVVPLPHAGDVAVLRLFATDFSMRHAVPVARGLAVPISKDRPQRFDCQMTAIEHRCCILEPDQYRRLGRKHFERSAAVAPCGDRPAQSAEFSRAVDALEQRLEVLTRLPFGVFWPCSDAVVGRGR